MTLHSGPGKERSFKNKMTVISRVHIASEYKNTEIYSRRLHKTEVLIWANSAVLDKEATEQIVT